MELREYEAFADEWLQAWNNRDVDAVLAHYTDDIELRSPIVAHLLGDASGMVVGKALLRDYVKTVFQAFPDKPRLSLHGVFQGVGSIIVQFRFNGGEGAELMELTTSGKVRRAIAHVRAITTFVIVACALITVTAAAAPVDGQRKQASRLRCDNSRIREVIQFALARSEAFQDLIATLDVSDRIVYVEEGSCPDRGHRSCLHLLPNSRNLVIHINPREPIRGAAATLAHELYHAAEIEGAPDVVDPESLRALYERIGQQSCNPQSHTGCWETRAARAFEALVMRQLASGKRSHGPETPNDR